MISKSEAEKLLGQLILSGEVVRAEPIHGTSPMLLVRVHERTPEVERRIQDALRHTHCRVEIAEMPVAHD